jgi:hypothetical protein
MNNPVLLLAGRVQQGDTLQRRTTAYSQIMGICLSGKFEEQRLIIVGRRNPVQEGELDQGRDVVDAEFQHESAAVGFDTFG